MTAAIRVSWPPGIMIRSVHSQPLGSFAMCVSLSPVVCRFSASLGESGAGSPRRGSCSRIISTRRRLHLGATQATEAAGPGPERPEPWGEAGGRRRVRGGWQWQCHLQRPPLRQPGTTTLYYMVPPSQCGTSRFRFQLSRSDRIGACRSVRRRSAKAAAGVSAATGGAVSPPPT